MSETAILVLLGGMSAMVLSAMLVVLITWFIIYKVDPTYSQYGFWKNVRLETAELLAGTLER